MQRCGVCGTTGIALGLSACPHCGSAALAGGGTVLPSVTVECSGGCRAAGVQRRIMLRSAAAGWVEFPDLRCTACGRQAVIVDGWPIGEDNIMPKITRHGGATNAAADREAAEAAPVAPAEEEAAAAPAEVAEETPAAEPAAADEPVEDTPVRPHNVDSKPKWLAYAQAIGVDDADQMTKPQLIEAADFWAQERAANKADSGEG
jgi:hypothetical protein